jgi:hypothetical protein
LWPVLYADFAIRAHSDFSWAEGLIVIM